jgi:hypothetical protein
MIPGRVWGLINDSLFNWMLLNIWYYMNMHNRRFVHFWKCWAGKVRAFKAPLIVCRISYNCRVAIGPTIMSSSLP